MTVVLLPSDLEGGRKERGGSSFHQIFAVGFQLNAKACLCSQTHVKLDETEVRQKEKHEREIKVSEKRGKKKAD